MKLFLKFLIIAITPLLFILAIDLFFSLKPFEFKNIFIIYFSVAFFSIIAFVLVYILENKLLKKYSLFRSLTISSIMVFVFIFFMSIVSNYFIKNEILIKAPFFQSISAIGLLVLFGFISNLIKNIKTENKLIFNQSISYNAKVIISFIVFLFIIISILNADYFIYDYTTMQILNILLKTILFISSITILSFLNQFYLTKFSFFQKNILFTFLISITLTTVVYLIMGTNFLKYFYQNIYTVGLVAFFSNIAITTIFIVNSSTDILKSKISVLSNSIIKSTTEYQQLKQQVNPHFLFNNLNVLISFIELNPKKAIEFGHHLSNTYRHFLKNQNEDFVSLKLELEFILEFLEIYKAKFHGGFTFNIKSIGSDFFVLSASLQELIDNIFKHNILNSLRPINIDIFLENDFLVVKNSKNLITENSNLETGLENINKRYQILIKKSIVIQNDKNFFCVKLPIIKLLD